MPWKTFRNLYIFNSIHKFYLLQDKLKMSIGWKQIWHKLTHLHAINTCGQMRWSLLLFLHTATGSIFIKYQIDRKKRQLCFRSAHFICAVHWHPPGLLCSHCSHKNGNHRYILRPELTKYMSTITEMKIRSYYTISVAIWLLLNFFRLNTIENRIRLVIERT